MFQPAPGSQQWWEKSTGAWLKSNVELPPPSIQLMDINGAVMKAEIDEWSTVWPEHMTHMEKENLHYVPVCKPFASWFLHLVPSRLSQKLPVEWNQIRYFDRWASTETGAHPSQSDNARFWVWSIKYIKIRERLKQEPAHYISKGIGVLTEAPQGKNQSTWFLQ